MGDHGGTVVFDEFCDFCILQSGLSDDSIEDVMDDPLMLRVVESPEPEAHARKEKKAHHKGTKDDYMELVAQTKKFGFSQMEAKPGQPEFSDLLGTISNVKREQHEGQLKELKGLVELEKSASKEEEFRLECKSGNLYSSIKANIMKD